jgi:CHAT domain-containing protein
MSSPQNISTRFFLMGIFRIAIPIALFLAITSGCDRSRRDTTPEQDPPSAVHHSVAADNLLSADSMYRVAEDLIGHNLTDSGLYWHLQALERRERDAGNKRKLVDSYRAIGAAYKKDFKYVMASRYLEKAKSLGDSAELDPMTLIGIYWSLSDCRSNLKDFVIAVSLLEHSLELISRYYPNNAALLARSYRLLGSTYYNNSDYERAISHALTAIRFTPRNDHRELANLYSILGMSYRDLGKYQKALESFNQSIRHDLTYSGPDSDVIAIRCHYKASVFSALGAMDSSLFYLHRNLQIRKNIHGEKNVNTFGAKYILGQFYERFGRYDSAARYYHASLISLIRNFNENDWRFLPVPSGDEINTDLVIGLAGKASALKQLYSRDTAQFEFLQLSQKTFFLADSIFNLFTRNFIADDPQLLQLETAYIPYPVMVDNALELFRHTKRQQFLDDAFTIMERSRAVVLQHALIRAESFGKAGLPDKLRQQENNLIATRQRILQQLSSAGAQAVADSLHRELLAINDRHQILMDQIEKSNPQYPAIKYAAEDLSIGQLKTWLQKRKTILLEYLWSENNIYALVVTSNDIQLQKVPLSTEFTDALNIVSAALTRSDNVIYDRQKFSRFCSASNFLYQKLIADQLAALPPQDPQVKLLISADGPLGSFPFDALIESVPATREVDYHLPYVILNHPISYTFSTRLLMKEAARFSGDRLVAFAYSSLGNEEKLAGLPGTDLELKGIGEEFDRNDRKVFYSGAAASETNFKQQIGNFNLVHLALHGVGDTVSALESHLVFRHGKDSLEDGRLYAHELYDLDLRNLRLAVLSACESGIGKALPGEGVMSIARAFAYSGCPSQVMSLWKVDDRATAELMTGFYKHLSSGDAIDLSLAMAKRDYLATANEFGSHPSYWAGFVQIGESTGLRAKFSYLTRILWVLTGAVISILVVLLLRRSASSRSPSSRKKLVF